MTRLVEFDRRLSAWLEEEAAPHAPSELHARFIEGMAEGRQRPGWATTERWISMETRAQFGAVPRAAMVLVTLGLLTALAVGAIVVGSSGTPEAPPPFGPAANGLIAFSSAGDIHVVEPDGSGRKTLTSDPAYDFAPHWSRDGSRLAFWSGPIQGSPPYQLKVIGAEGGDATVIAETPGDEVGAFMTWSEDGSEIAYSAIDPTLGERTCPVPAASGGMCGSRVFVAATDGSGTRQIGDPELDARNPELSSDGRSLAFGGGLAASDALYLMAWDGSGVRPMTSEAVTGGDWGFVHQSWSPDGSRIVTQDELGDIWVVDGSGETNVSDDPFDERIASFASGDDAIAWIRGSIGTMLLTADAAEASAIPTYVDRVVWSPDGTALVGSAVGGARLIVVDRVGTVLAEIEAPEQPAQPSFPSWQRLAP